MLEKLSPFSVNVLLVGKRSLFFDRMTLCSSALLEPDVSEKFVSTLFKIEEKARKGTCR
jgi:hypothetical protein